MTSSIYVGAYFLLLVYSAHAGDVSDSPPTMTRALFHGTRGALRLGVVGVEPVEHWDAFPPWRRFFNAWMTRVNGPFVPEVVEPPYMRYYDHETTRRDWNGTRWTIDARERFRISMPDEELERLGLALGLNASHSHVEVVLSGDALDEDHRSYVISNSAKDVDAYVLFVENADDVVHARDAFVRDHDQRIVSHQFHATKWAHRTERTDRRCEYDAWKKAFDALVEAEGSLASVNWSQSELNVLAPHELRSLKPVIYIIGVPREAYVRQDPAFVAAIKAWVHENHVGESRPPVILTSVELEEDLAQQNSSLGSVFDDILAIVLRDRRLTRFYVIREPEVQAWYISPVTRASVAAGVVFHQPCDEPIGHSYRDGAFCSSHYSDFNETAQSFLGRVDVGRADVLSAHNHSTALDERVFARESRDYRIQEGDVVRFVVGSERTEEAEEQCVGFEDARPRLLHPIGADLRICIIGESNAGKTTVFNFLTGSYNAVSPQVFTTRNVTARSAKIPDDRFEWLSKQFPEATLRSPTITFVDTPALLDPFESAPWEARVCEALRHCDILYHVIRAFNDSSVEHWRSEGELEEERRRRMLPYGGEIDSEELEDDPPPRHAESARAVDDILQAYDRRLLAKLRKNETFRDDLDALTSIAENVRGYRDDDHKFNGRRVMTDSRARFHDWDERELAVLERTQLLTAKPVVYLLNMDTEEFANATSSATFLRAQEDIEETDIDAVVLPFSGRLLQHEEKAPFLDAAKPTHADGIINETLEDCGIAHFYTASKILVAAWSVKLGTTVEEAVTLVNATLDSSVTVVEAVSMRAVVDAGSIDKARRLGLTRRLRFQDAVEDGDLLFLAPGELEGAANEITDSASITMSTHEATMRPAPSGEQGSCIASINYVSLALNFVLFIGLLLALLSNRELIKRIRTYLEARRRRRGQRLLAAVRFDADSGSIKF